MVVVLMPWLRTRRLRPSGAVEIACLLPVGFAVWALYHRDFGGFPNLDGWDGGSHVLIKDLFAGVAPDIYSRQVSYYGYVWWLEKIFHLDAFRSFAMAFYVAVIGTLALAMTITFTFLRGEAQANRMVRSTGIVATALATGGILWLVLLPLLHYNQAAGYYVHLFALLPLMLVWAVDVCVRLQFLRVLALLGGVALLRYSYALNLADVAVATAFVLLFEGFRGRWRIIQGLLVAGLSAAAYVAIRELRPVFRVWGGMQRFDMDEILKADLLLVGIVFVYTVATAWKNVPWDFIRSRLFRTVRFPLFFALASSTFLSIFRKEQGVQYYYPTKYQIWACMLLAFVLVIVLAHLLQVWATRLSWRRPRAYVLAALVGLLLATVPSIWQKTFAGYRETLQERMGPHHATYKYLRPLADVEAVARIKSVLSTNHKQFGGYLTSFFPMFSFMNGMFGHHAGHQEFFSPASEPGHCVFWVSKDRDTFPLGPTHILDGLRNRAAGDGSTCDEYKVPWKSTPQSLCYHCY